MMVLSLEVGLTFKKIDDTIIQKKNKTFLLFFFHFSSFPKNNFKLFEFQLLIEPICQKPLKSLKGDKSRLDQKTISIQEN